jgi:hypothetical protein
LYINWYQSFFGVTKIFTLRKLKLKLEMALKPILILAICLSQVLGVPLEERPSEASMKLAREIVAYYKGQNNKQFFPYYPVDPYQQQQQQQQQYPR